MEPGSVYGNRYIAWLPPGERVPMWFPKEERFLTRMSWLMPKKAPARRCTTCRRVEFTY